MTPHKANFFSRPSVVMLVIVTVAGLFLTACGESGVAVVSSDPATPGPATSTASPSTTAVLTTAPASTTAPATTAASRPTIETGRIGVVDPPTSAAATSAAPIQTTAAPTTTQPVPTTELPTTLPATAIAPRTVTPAATIAVAAPSRGPGKLAFAAKDGNIYTVNPDGSNETRLVRGFSPQFSPDGTRIAFLTFEPRPGNAFPGLITFRSIRTDGTDRQDYCTNAPTYSANISQILRWSPRSRYLAFSGYAVGADGPGFVGLCDLADKSISQVKRGLELVSSLYDWTADGEKALWLNGPEIFYGDPDKAGAGPVALTKGQFRNGGEGASAFYTPYDFARFSPDGRTVAIGGSKIFFVSVPGQPKSPLEGKSIELPPQTLHIGSLAWSPDGQRLAISYYGQLSFSVLGLIDLSGAKFGRLSRLPGPYEDLHIGDLDWSR